jgi:hypothetical protein
MLFRPQDFENPSASPLYHDLLNSPDEQVRDLAHYLFELARYDLHDIPPVDEVLLWCESLESLISAQQWDKVLQLVERMGPGERIAPELQAFVVEAQQRVACRQAMETALAQGDEDRVEQLYNTGLLHNYPDAQYLLEPASRAPEVRPLLQVLAAASQAQSWDTLKQTYLVNQQLLNDRISAKPYRDEVERLVTVDRIKEHLAAPHLDHRALLESWDRLQQLGGHPLAEPFRAEVERHVAWRQSMTKLQELLLQAPTSPTLAFDKKIVAAVTPEVLKALNPQSPLVKQYQAARKRLEYVRKVHDVEKVGSVESETFIAQVMQHLPNAYHEGLALRSQQARKRLFVHRELVRALQEPCSEAEVVRVWEQLGKVRGRVMVTPEMKARVELAEARLPLLKALQEIPESASEAQREQRVLEVWNDTTLGGCPEAAPWLPVYLKAKTFQEQVRKLAAAVEAENAAEVVRLTDLPALQGRELPPELGSRVRELRQREQQAVAAKRQAIVNTLRENDRTAFVQLFDAEALADICRQFRHHQPVVSQLVEAEILPLARLGLQADPETAVRRDEQGNLHIVWTWPPPNVSHECRLAITKKRPAPHVQPGDVQAEHAAVLRRQDWNEDSGYQVPLNPEWEGAFVFVWVVVNLDYQVFYSQPFEVGQIKPLVAAKRRWGLFRSWKTEKPPKETAETPVEATREQAATDQAAPASPESSGQPSEASPAPPSPQDAPPGGA